MKNTKFIISFFALILTSLPAILNANDPIAFEVYGMVTKTDSMVDIYEVEAKIGEVTLNDANRVYFMSFDPLPTEITYCPELASYFPNLSLIQGKTYSLRPKYDMGLSRKNDLVAIIILGKIVATTSFWPWVDQTIEIGRLDITEENQHHFADLPIKGQIITYRDFDMKDIYKGTEYSRQYQLVHGKSYGIIPEFHGDTPRDVLKRIDLRGSLSPLS